MTRLFIAFTLAMLMIGCASTQEHAARLQAQESSTAMVAFGTLATFGTFEMELAPAYTRLAVLRHNAAAALRKGKISVEVAKKIQRGANLARVSLDQAKLADANMQPNVAHIALAEGLTQIETTEGLLP